MKIRNIVATMFLLLIITLSACSSDYSEVFEKNWGFSLPKGYEELYVIDSGASFHGDGERYHIFKYKQEIELNNIEKFSSEKNINLEKQIETILNSLQISTEKGPDFSKDIIGIEKVEIMIRETNCYYKEDKLLHIIEEFY